MSKDWKGNKHSTFVTLGGIGHSQEEREENDYYATDPLAAIELLNIEPQIDNIWENAVGAGHLATVFNKVGKLRVISDLVDRGYRPEGIPVSYGKDFMQMNKMWKGDIVTNPPYSVAIEWAEHCLSLIQEGRYVALFLKLTFLEGKARKEFFKKNPPIRIWVSSSRIPCARNGEFEIFKKDKSGNIKYDKEGNPIKEKVSSATSYAWFIWQKGFKGFPEIRWFN